MGKGADALRHLRGMADQAAADLHEREETMRAMDEQYRPHNPPSVTEDKPGYPAWLWLSDHAARWHTERASKHLADVEEGGLGMGGEQAATHASVALAHATTASAIIALAMHDQMRAAVSAGPPGADTTVEFQAQVGQENGDGDEPSP